MLKKIKKYVHFEEIIGNIIGMSWKMKELRSTNSPSIPFLNFLFPICFLILLRVWLYLYFYIVIQLHQSYSSFLPLHSLYFPSLSLSNLWPIYSLHCSCIHVCMMYICIYIPKCNLLSLYIATPLSEMKKNSWCSDIENKSKGIFNFIPNFYIWKGVYDQL